MSTHYIPPSLIPSCASLVSTSQSSFDIRNFDNEYEAPSETIISLLKDAGKETFEEYKSRGVKFPTTGSVVSGKEPLNVQSIGTNFRR
jgi:hypothetical protein